MLRNSRIFTMSSRIETNTVTLQSYCALLNYARLIAVIIACICMSVRATTFIAPINLLEPWNVLIKPDLHGCKPYLFALYAEGGFGTVGYNRHGCKVNALQIWNPEQNVLKMLTGFGASNPISQKSMQVDATDDGTRGHVVPCGNLQVDFAGAFSAYFKVGHCWMFSAHVPFLRMALTDVSYTDLTQDNTAEDLRVKELLTDNLAQVICQLGDGLDIGSWRRTGVADGVFIAHWMNDFPQKKPFLKNVNITFRVGTTVPFGQKEDEDLLVAFPFGNDRAGAVFGGFGLTLTLGNTLRVGADIQLDHTFGSIRTRRIKTDVEQTELFLLEKIASYKDNGLTQEFNLFGECFDLIPGFSFLLGYEYLKHSDDVLSIFSNAFSSSVATNAQKLFDWTLHQIVVRFGFDSTCWCGEQATVIPSGALYMRLPFNGRRSIGLSMIGGYFALKF